MPLRRATAERRASPGQPRQPPRRETPSYGRAGQHDAPGWKARRALQHAQDDQPSQAVADEMQPRRGDVAAETREALRVFREREPHRRIGVSERAKAAARHAPPHQLHRDAVDPQAVHQDDDFCRHPGKA